MTKQAKCAVIPLFPLNVVLFPGGSLQLRVFEPRYHDMVGECVRKDSGFGICLATSTPGGSVRERASFHSIGTLVKIIDWDRLDDGLLGITVRGVGRFKAVSTSMRPSRLVEGEVVRLSEVSEGMTEDYVSFSELLQEIANRFELSLDVVPDRYDEAIWVSGRLAELLPFEMVAKQRMLEMDNPLRRFDYMQVLLESLDREGEPVLQ